MEIVAKLKKLRVSPRKMRLVVDLVRNVNVINALKILKYSPKRGSFFLKKLLLSAISNWQNKNKGLKIENSNLYIKSIFVNCSSTLKRIRPAPQGKAHGIRRRFSNIIIVLADNF